MTACELGLVLVSALLHSWWSAVIKSSRDPLVFNLLQLIAPALLMLAILPFVTLGEVPGAVWKLLAATGLCHGLYFYWMSLAFERGDLTLVYPIARSTPAFLPFIAVPWLGESLSVAGGLGIAIVVAGIWLVNAGHGWRWSALAAPGAGFAYLTLAATVGYSLFDKSAMAELAAAPWTSRVPRAAFFCLLLSVASAVVFAPLTARHRSLRALRAAARADLVPATLATLVSFVGYALILRALETAPASYVVAVRQISVLFALALGVFWLREAPSRSRVLGAAATVVGVLLIALGP